MKISTEQIQSILNGDNVSQIKVDEAVIRLTDADLIKEIEEKVAAMPDRESMVEELKARIQAGSYNPTGDEIADAMIRRSIADRVK